MAEVMPNIRWGFFYPELIDSVSVSRTGNRAISFVEYADPFWQVQPQTQRLSATERNLLEAFIGRCKRGMVTIHYTPKHQCILRAYWGDPNNAALTNTGVVTAIANGNQISFNSVATALQIKQGDLIGLTVGDYNLIVRALADQTAVAGVITALPVEPPIPTYITVGAVVKFKDPVMNMRLLPNSYEAPDENKPVARFTLVEVPK